MGCILLVLFVANCVAICSGDGKCKLLKKALGVFYSLMGLLIIIVGAVTGGDSKAIFTASMESSTTKTKCALFESYQSAWAYGLQTKAKIFADSTDTCASATTTNAWSQTMAAVENSSSVTGETLY